MKRILITGSCGQIGSELTLKLVDQSSCDMVVASDIKEPSEKLMRACVFENIDVNDYHKIADIVKKHNIRTIYHLACTNSADEWLCTRDEPTSCFSYIHNTPHFHRSSLLRTCHDKHAASELVLFNSKTLTLLALCSLKCGISYRIDVLSFPNRALYKHRHSGRDMVHTFYMLLHFTAQYHCSCFKKNHAYRGYARD